MIGLILGFAFGGLLPTYILVQVRNYYWRLNMQRRLETLFKNFGASLNRISR